MKDCFSSKMGKGCLAPLLLGIVLEVVAIEIRQEKDIVNAYVLEKEK